MFRHDGPPGKPSGPPRPPSNEPPSAATPAKDGKPKSPSPAPKRRPSRGRSRSKDKTRTAERCISYALGAPTKREVRVNPKPHARHIDVEGMGSPHLARQRRYSATYADSSHCPKPDRRDLTQAIEAAKELEAIAEASIMNVQVPCDSECSDFGLTCHALPTAPDSSSWPIRAVKKTSVAEAIMNFTTQMSSRLKVLQDMSV